MKTKKKTMICEGCGKTIDPRWFSRHPQHCTRSLIPEVKIEILAPTTEISLSDAIKDLEIQIFQDHEQLKAKEDALVVLMEVRDRKWSR